MFGYSPFGTSGFGGGSAPPGGEVSEVLSVVVSPGAVTLAGGFSQQFTAVALGIGELLQEFTWTTTDGEVSDEGMLVAPSAGVDDLHGVVTATSVQDPTKSGTAYFTVPAVTEETPEPPYGAGLLNTYEELQSAIKGWLHRPNLAPKIPLFIALAEAKINRIAQVQAMEKEAVLLLQPGTRSVALPAGFMTPIAAWIDGASDRQDLAACTPESLPVTAQRGNPTYWAVDGARLAVECPVAVRRRVTLRYRGGFALSDSAPSNSLLLKHPDLYLYGALLQAAPYLRDFDSKPLWQEQYNEAVREVNKSESRARAIAPLRTELAGLLGCR